jgi:hypothetical protein
LWEAVNNRLARLQLSGMVEAGERFGEPHLIRPRLGQGAFRVLVTDIYRRRCAVTLERTLPALEAAHIDLIAKGACTKLEMPGWAGEPAPRSDGSHEYAWHCAPFTEGAQYGIEVFNPYENELHVSKKDGALHFDGDFGPVTCNGRRSANSAATIIPISFCSI